MKKKFDQDFCLNLWYDPLGYFGKMNSTLGSVVSLAMFLVLLFSRRGRDPIVVLGFILSMLAYFLTFLAIPNSANLNETEELAFIDPNRFLVIVLNLKFDPLFRYLIIFIAFLLGFSDACFNTQVRFRSLSQIGQKAKICDISQITSILGGVFKEQSSSAFAIFKFMQSLSAAIAFFYSPYLRWTNDLVLEPFLNLRWLQDHTCGKNFPNYFVISLFPVYNGNSWLQWPSISLAQLLSARW